MPETEPIFWPLDHLVGAFASGRLSPVEVTEEALDRIGDLDPRLHSYLTVTADVALEQARAAEAAYRSGTEPLPPLLGVPLSIKDLFDVAGVATSLGSLAFGHAPASDDSQPVAALRRAGAVFLGKTNTAEFGQSATTVNLLGPACGNPWDPERTPGGSSGGAAASVGAGLASAALGSDGGGSVRIPAAMCGLVGVKPTFARTAPTDTFHAMTEFVCPGPIARTVTDARLLLSVLLGRSLDGGDDAGAARRIGWCPAPEGNAVDPGVHELTSAAVTLLARRGHRVEEVSLPLRRWQDAFGPLVLSDEWRHRGHLLDGSADLLTRYVRRTLVAGEHVSDEEIATARLLKEEITARVASVFERYDVVITPTMASVAFPIGERPTEIGGRRVDPLWGAFPFTAPFNVTGSPAASVPVGLVGGLPVGLQVIGPHHREDLVLGVCQAVEEAVAFPSDELVRRWSRAEPETAR